MPKSTRASAKSGPGRRGRKRKRGRPIVHKEAWSKVTVVLFDRQIVDLDRLIADIRGRTGVIVSRTLVIRSLIDGLFLSGMDVTDCLGEADLRDRIVDRLAVS